MLAKYNHKPWKYIKWAILEKSKQEGEWGWGYTVLKISMEFLIFFTLSLEVPGKTKFNPCISYKVVLDPLEIPQGQKQRPLEISHYFFLVTLGNSTSFLINSWKFHSMWLFLWYPWKFHILNPPPLYLRGGRVGPSKYWTEVTGGGGDGGSGGGTKNFARKGLI